VSGSDGGWPAQTRSALTSAFNGIGEGQSRSPFEFELANFLTREIGSGGCFELYSKYVLQIQAVAASVNAMS
jgi:hypothetical protein